MVVSGTRVPAVGDNTVERYLDGRAIADALRRNGDGAEGLFIADGPTAVTEIRLTSERDLAFEREDARMRA